MEDHPVTVTEEDIILNAVEDEHKVMVVNITKMCMDTMYDRLIAQGLGDQESLYVVTTPDEKYKARAFVC